MVTETNIWVYREINFLSCLNYLKMFFNTIQSCLPEIYTSQILILVRSIMRRAQTAIDQPRWRSLLRMDAISTSISSTGSWSRAQTLGWDQQWLVTLVRAQVLWSLPGPLLEGADRLHLAESLGEHEALSWCLTKTRTLRATAFYATLLNAC